MYSEPMYIEEMITEPQQVIYESAPVQMSLPPIQAKVISGGIPGITAGGFTEFDVVDPFTGAVVERDFVDTVGNFDSAAWLSSVQAAPMTTLPAATYGAPVTYSAPMAAPVTYSGPSYSPVTNFGAAPVTTFGAAPVTTMGARPAYPSYGPASVGASYGSAFVGGQAFGGQAFGGQAFGGQAFGAPIMGGTRSFAGAVL
jgi:hypothetical protein